MNQTFRKFFFFLRPNPLEKPQATRAIIILSLVFLIQIGLRFYYLPIISELQEKYNQERTVIEIWLPWLFIFMKLLATILFFNRMKLGWFILFFLILMDFSSTSFKMVEFYLFEDETFRIMNSYRPEYRIEKQMANLFYCLGILWILNLDSVIMAFCIKRKSIYLFLMVTFVLIALGSWGLSNFE